MIRAQLSWLCTSLLIWASLAQAAIPDQATLQQRLERAGAGSVVEVTLQTGNKVRGRLGNLKTAAFELQRFVSQKLVTETLAFGEVRSVKVKKRGIEMDEAEARNITPKEKLALMPEGELVTVRLLDKQKLRGRLGALNESAFELQPVRTGRAAVATIPYEQLVSVNRSSNLGLGYKILIGFGIGVGILFGFAAIMCATGHCDS